MYNVMRQAQQLARDVPLLNQHQHSIYDNVIDAVHDPRPVDKTFLLMGWEGMARRSTGAYLFRGFWHKAEPTLQPMPNNSKLGQTTCNTFGRAQSKSFLRLGRKLF
jgi:hypothetical protein